MTLSLVQGRLHKRLTNCVLLFSGFPIPLFYCNRMRNDRHSSVLCLYWSLADQLHVLMVYLDINLNWTCQYLIQWFPASSLICPEASDLNNLCEFLVVLSDFSLRTKWFFKTDWKFVCTGTHSTDQRKTDCLNQLCETSGRYHRNYAPKCDESMCNSRDIVWFSLANVSNPEQPIRIIGTHEDEHRTFDDGHLTLYE